jgi:hypothetical protein
LRVTFHSLGFCSDEDIMNLSNWRRAKTAPLLSITLLGALAPGLTFACACGCGIFDVGTASMFPTQQGGMVWAEYDFMDQNKNWSGTSSAPAANNDDKRIRTSFINVGLQYQFNQAWGVELEVPYWHRLFKTVDDDTGGIDSFTHGALGDIRIKGIYNGFSSDLSSGITFGVKLPTGDSTYANFDPDTEISSGSTDTLLGAYHLGNITADTKWRYFTQVQWDEPVAHKTNYRPGRELVAVAGGYYEGWYASPDVKIAPVLQLSASYRGHDGGVDGLPGDSGYVRLLVTPGVEVDIKHVSVYADVGLPVYVNTSGNQLVASQFYRLNLAYHF